MPSCATRSAAAPVWAYPPAVNHRVLFTPSQHFYGLTGKLSPIVTLLLSAGSLTLENGALYRSRLL
jgi:hypothetical protein